MKTQVGYDQFINESIPTRTIRRILTTLCPNEVGELVTKIRNHMNEDEQLDIYQWSNNWYYVTVIDNRFGKYPYNIRVGFTVNIKDDRIMWNNDSRDNLSGGNCFVRSMKWKKFVKQNWNKGVSHEMMHHYRTTKIVK